MLNFKYFTYKLSRALHGLYASTINRPASSWFIQIWKNQRNWRGDAPSHAAWRSWRSIHTPIVWTRTPHAGFSSIYHVSPIDFHAIPRHHDDVTLLQLAVRVTWICNLNYLHSKSISQKKKKKKLGKLARRLGVLILLRFGGSKQFCSDYLDLYLILGV